jgi:TRAP-type C4-dicarboxylate transport system substrate-binding protein
LQKIVDKIYEYSDGRITVVPYWGDVLGDWVWVLEQVSRGEIEMAMDPVPTEVDPRLNCVHMQYLYIGYEGAKNALGPGGKLLGLYKELAADNNWYLLGTEPTGSYGICTKDKIIRNPEDAKGVKIRVMPVKACEYGFNAMGFIATPIPYAELYTALQTGIVDARAESTPSEPIYFKDVIKYNIMTYDNFEVHWVVINLDLWNSLSKEDQQIIQRAVDEAVGYSWENYLENMEKPYLEEFAALPGKENIYLTNAELAVFAKRVREQAWPKMEELLGKTLYEKMLEVAEPLPE